MRTLSAVVVVVRFGREDGKRYASKWGRTTPIFAAPAEKLRPPSGLPVEVQGLSPSPSAPGRRRSARARFRASRASSRSAPRPGPRAPRREDESGKAANQRTKGCRLRSGGARNPLTNTANTRLPPSQLRVSSRLTSDNATDGSLPVRFISRAGSRVTAGCGKGRSSQVLAAGGRVMASGGNRGHCGLPSATSARAPCGPR